MSSQTFYQTTCERVWELNVQERLSLRNLEFFNSIVQESHRLTPATTHNQSTDSNTQATKYTEESGSQQELVTAAWSDAMASRRDWRTMEIWGLGSKIERLKNGPPAAVKNGGMFLHRSALAKEKQALENDAKTNHSRLCMWVDWRTDRASCCGLGRPPSHAQPESDAGPAPAWRRQRENEWANRDGPSRN
jgi:hypothetical protein